ncbi:hypothetical protein BB558_007409, partial [Smittium angustum]
NLGLIKIEGSCTSEIFKRLVSARLKLFGLNFKNSIVRSTHDGASIKNQIQCCQTYTQPSDYCKNYTDKKAKFDSNDGKPKAEDETESVGIFKYNTILRRVRIIARHIRKSSMELYSANAGKQAVEYLSSKNSNILREDATYIYIYKKIAEIDSEIAFNILQQIRLILTTEEIFK